MSDHTLAAQLTKSDLAEEPRGSGSRQAKDDFDIWLEAGRTERHYWLDLWRYRELFLILAWRDIAVRYKQTLVGVTWSLLQPFLTMLIMTFVFGKLAGLHSESSAPYAIYLWLCPQ